MLDDAGRGGPSSRSSKASISSCPATAAASSPGRSRKSGLLGLPKRSLPEREGLVEQQPAGRDGADDVGQDRAVQVVGHHDQIEAAARQAARGCRPRDPPRILVRPGRIGLLIGIAVQGRDRKAMLQQQPAMPPAPGRQIEGRAAAGGQRQEAKNPGRGS